MVSSSLNYLICGDGFERTQLLSAYAFVDEAEANVKTKSIMHYAKEKAKILGDAAEKVVNSTAFFNPKWLNKTCSVKKYQDEIDSIIQNAAKDINTILTTGGDNTSILMARYPIRIRMV